MELCCLNLWDCSQEQLEQALSNYLLATANDAEQARQRWKLVAKRIDKFARFWVVTLCARGRAHRA